MACPTCIQAALDRTGLCHLTKRVRYYRSQRVHCGGGGGGEEMEIKWKREHRPVFVGGVSFWPVDPVEERVRDRQRDRQTWRHKESGSVSNVILLNTYTYNNGANANWSCAGKWFWIITNINDFLKRSTWNPDWLQFFSNPYQSWIEGVGMNSFVKSLTKNK